MSEPSERALAAAREWHDSPLFPGNKEDWVNRVAIIIDKHMTVLGSTEVVEKVREILRLRGMMEINDNDVVDSLIAIIERTGRKVSDAN
jgi:hypothetical protein